ncbi:uncharacterized protein PHACADRAFT_256603 [Phanerochaete carnosa HHB-10118-sp]|uniref:Uncharacterized protein n=1 Tax=Phanerochaete carnosa (strain HHB-10118-sp) TaxID=650164 RepID=K5VW19_PHACS|nr:uncharacterized protein PHACADRAFT_256603 [Phanerochaete carnosa HHB-10118-sp]EKM55748.1 hypothetical protein PHACADRAFT_256603 [Phanerochaete carnosa HHB-10118-sp]
MDDTPTAGPPNTHEPFSGFAFANPFELFSLSVSNLPPLTEQGINKLMQIFHCSGWHRKWPPKLESSHEVRVPVAKPANIQWDLADQNAAGTPNRGILHRPTKRDLTISSTHRVKGTLKVGLPPDSSTSHPHEDLGGRHG